MAMAATRRDYSLVGPDSRAAEEKGLASAQWYACPIPRKELKELMRRKDGPAIRDTLIWLGGLRVSAARSAIISGERWWAVPFFARLRRALRLRRRTAAGTNAAMAPRSRRAG